MPTIHYYGKKTNFVGKTLFEILANLRNFGINRMVLKNEELMNNPGRPCYYIVKKVEPVINDTLQEGAIYAERVFQGARVPGLSFIDDETWHTDWQLVPKHRERLYIVENPPEYKEPEKKTKEFALPPLMEVFLDRHRRLKEGSSKKTI